MKKFAAILMVLVLAVFTPTFLGCGGDDGGGGGTGGAGESTGGESGEGGSGD
jgi:hypothetical protein